MRYALSKKIRIVIVEDDKNVSIVLSSRLESLGYTVCTTARTGPEAIAAVTKHRPDLVTMDILLEGRMNGVEAAAQINSESDVPIIFMTCLSDQGIFDKAIKTNPYGYIVKPYDINELRSSIEIAVIKHRADKSQKVLISRLKGALSEVKKLSGLLSICAACKRIHSEEDNKWHPIEGYISSHSQADFTHGICPECAKKLYPELYRELKDRGKRTEPV